MVKTFDDLKTCDISYFLPENYTTLKERWGFVFKKHTDDYVTNKVCISTLFCFMQTQS